MTIETALKILESYRKSSDGGVHSQLFDALTIVEHFIESSIQSKWIGGKVTARVRGFTDPQIGTLQYALETKDGNHIIEDLQTVKFCHTPTMDELVEVYSERFNVPIENIQIPE
jgi:hypothetical protein